MLSFFPKNSKWAKILKSEFSKDYFKKLDYWIDNEYLNNTVYPPREEIFNAFKLTDFKDIKVVIIGQDPYHRDGQAHGLLFSVLPQVKIPPSLKNIFKELNNDLNVPIAKHGNLESWARQGVFLLNTILTVEEGRPGSHRKQGWETFTDAVINSLSQKRKNLIFVLWGNFAKSKSSLIDHDKHLVLQSNHPSPLSAYRGFFRNNHFSKINNYLKKNDSKIINWKLDEISPH